MTATIAVWYSFPLMIKWKINQRKNIKNKNGDLIFGINTSILFDCTCLIEGIIEEILVELLFYGKVMNNKKLEFEELKRIEKRVNNAQWKDYPILFQEISNIKIKEATDNELWKSIQILFNFRNTLIHGNEIRVDYFQNDDKTIRVEVSKKYNKIYQYLLEKNFVKKNVKSEFEDVDLVSSEISNHFYHQSERFLLNLLEIVDDLCIKDIRETVTESLEAKV